MKQAGVTLTEYTGGLVFRGLLTGLNQAFVIDGRRRAELISADPVSSEIIKPFAVGDNVRRWRIDYPDKWLIYSPWDLQLDQYPAVRVHLEQWKAQLESRPEVRRGVYKWWCMARYGAEYERFIGSPKILYPEIASSTRFALDTSSVYPNNKAFLIAVADLYLLGVLNSSVTWEFTKSICAVLGDENAGGRVMLQWVNFRHLPIPNASPTDRNAIADLVQQCLDARGQGPEVAVWEAEIDERVARLYGLSGDGQVLTPAPTDATPGAELLLP